MSTTIELIKSYGCQPWTDLYMAAQRDAEAIANLQLELAEAKRQLNMLHGRPFSERDYTAMRERAAHVVRDLQQELAEARAVVRRALEWTPVFPIDASLLDDMASIAGHPQPPEQP